MKRLWGLMLCVLALGAQAAEVMSPENFTAEMRAALAASFPDRKIEVVEPLHLKVTGPDDQEVMAFLDNAYNEYSLNPARKADVIARYTASLAEGPKSTGPLNPQQIVPVIKDRGWAKDVRRATKARGAKEMAEQVMEELNQDLIIVYAEDSPQNIRYFSPKELQETGLRKEQLRALALENLRKLLPPPQAVRGPLVSMLTAGGDYVPSLLLLDDVWDRSKLGVEGEIVIAIPTRDVLLYTDSANKDGVKKLRELARKTAADGPYSLTDRLFVYRAGKFERF